MSTDEIVLLKYFASIENVSVEYYDGGKTYQIPVAAFLLDSSYDPFEDYDENMNVYIDCTYIATGMGMPYVVCEISCEDAKTPIEKTIIPLDEKKRTKHQRELMSLINLCSKRVIAQEMSRKKYAITTALSTLNANKEYS